MKVLHFIDSLGRGGAEQLLAVLLPELQRQDVPVTVAVRGGAMDLEPDLLAAGIKVVRLPLRHRWNVIGAARDVGALAKSEGADIVHAHLYFPTLYTAVMRVARLSSSKTCATFHNLAYAGANRKTAKLAFRRALSVLISSRGIDRCLAVSNSVADHYRKALSLSDIRVLPNPVDLSRLGNVHPSAQGPDRTGSACRVMLPGRIVHEKGHTDFISALGLLKGRGLLPIVTIAGDGPMRAEIERLVELGDLTGSVRFTGALPHAEMMQEMADADIVIVPSRFEGFGITALEGMALGRAVIATRAGGLAETMGDTGVLVDVENPLGLAAAMEQLLMDPARRRQLGAAARERAKLFDLPGIASQLVAIYSALVSTSSAKAEY